MRRSARLACRACVLSLSLLVAAPSSAHGPYRVIPAPLGFQWQLAYGYVFQPFGPWDRFSPYFFLPPCRPTYRPPCILDDQIRYDPRRFSRMGGDVEGEAPPASAPRRDVPPTPDEEVMPQYQSSGHVRPEFDAVGQPR